MSGREWLPDDYFDETIPELRAHPSSWIVDNNDGVPTLSDFYGDPGKPLEDGFVLRFRYHEDHGKGAVTIADDLSWTAPPMPEGANSAWTPDAWDLGGNASIEGLIGDLTGLASLEPGTMVLHFSFWSEPLPYRYDGATRRFVEVAS